MDIISIRKLELDDYSDLFKIWNEESVREFALTRQCLTLAEARAKTERYFFEDSYYSFVAVSSEQGVIGIITLTRNLSWKMEHVGELSIMIREDFQGKGIGKKLFAETLKFSDEVLGLKVLQLTCHIDNHSGIHLYEKFGFKKEGVMEKRVFDGKKYKDLYMMARITR